MKAAFFLLAATTLGNGTPTPVKISLPELINRALESNPALRADQHRAYSLRHTVNQREDEAGWRGWDLAVEGEYYPSTSVGSELSGVDRRLNLNLNLPVFGSHTERELGAKTAEAELAFAQGEVETRRREILTNLLGHYLVYTRSFSTNKALSQIEEKLQEKIRQLRVRQEQGESLRADRLSAERDLAELNLRRERNREAKNLALEGIRMQIGESNLQEFEPVSLPWEDIASKTLPPLEALLDRVQLRSPEFQGLRRKAELLGEQAEAVSAAYPRSAISVGYVGQWNQNSEFESGPSIAFSLSVPLGVSSIADSRKEALLSEKQRALAELDRKSQSMIFDVRNRYQDWLSQNEKLRLYDSQLRLAREQERVATLQADNLPETADKPLLLSRLDSQINRLEANLLRESAIAEITGTYFKLLLSLGEIPAFDQPSIREALPSGLFAWVWDTRIVEEDEQFHRFFEVAERWRLGGIAISLNQEEQRRLFGRSASELRRFLARAHERGMKVEFLQSENSWVLVENRPHFERILADLLRFQDGGEAKERFDALHLDVEPYSMQEWKKGTQLQAELAQGLVDLCVLARKSALPVFIDIPSWYEKFSLRESSLLEKLLEQVDGIVVMNYRTDFDRFMADAQEELRQAAVFGKEIRIGVSAESFLPSSEAFPDFESLAQHLTKSAATFREKKGFGGLFIQGYRDFETLLQGDHP